MEELLQEIESLFLVGRHAEAVDKCRNALSDLGSVERAFFESKFKPLPAVDLVGCSARIPSHLPLALANSSIPVQ